MYKEYNKYDVLAERLNPFCFGVWGLSGQMGASSCGLLYVLILFVLEYGV